MVGDGSYLMINSEIATSVMLGKKLNIVVLDNGGFGCIDRLQRSCGGASFNNLLPGGSGVDFAAHAASLRAKSRKVASLAELEATLPEIRVERHTSVIVIATDPAASTTPVVPGGMSRSPRYPTGRRSLPPAPPMTWLGPTSRSPADPSRLRSLRCAALGSQLGRVGVWRGGFRPTLSVAAPFVWRCLTGAAIAPFPHPAHR